MTQEKIKELAGVFGKVHEVSNNGREGFGLNTGNIVSPVFYFDVFDGMTETEAFNFIKGMLEKASPKLDIESLNNWETAQSKVYPHLAMKIQGDDLVVEKFLNMDLYFRYEFTDELTTKVTNSLMDMWGISAEMLKEKALQNMKKRGYEMMDIFTAMLGSYDNVLVSEIELHGDLYTFMCKGESAACLLDNHLLDKIAGRLNKEQIIILPSSTHELLVLNSDTEATVSDLREMIVDINQTQVAKHEWLSDTPYIYDVTKGELKIYE